MDCRFCGAEMADGWVALHGGFPIAAWNIGLMWEPAEIRTMKRRWRDIGDPATFDGDSVEAAVGGPTPDDLVDGLIGRLG